VLGAPTADFDTEIQAIDPGDGYGGAVDESQRAERHDVPIRDAEPGSNSEPIGKSPVARIVSPQL